MRLRVPGGDDSASRSRGCGEIVTMTQPGAPSKTPLPRRSSEPGPLDATQEIAPYLLVVEDDDAVRGALVDSLLDQGWDVLDARNGAEALGLICERRPQAILLDLLMPVMDGSTLLEELRHDPGLQSIPVVVLTGSGQAPYAQGARAVLSKPINLAVLFETIRRVAGVQGH